MNGESNNRRMRRWWQFGLRGLLVLALVVRLPVATKGCHERLLLHMALAPSPDALAGGLLVHWKADGPQCVQQRLAGYEFLFRAVPILIHRKDQSPRAGDEAQAHERNASDDAAVASQGADGDVFTGQ